uniref:BPTI/Kunitz inhibitor domain-containing protein n=1 Tax=Spermophilus dauricus TaxID=99837 RepID=A0A8C9UKZ6_SPEDA
MSGDVRLLLLLLCVCVCVLPGISHSSSPNSMGTSHADPCVMDVNPGDCFDIFIRYFYNQTSKKCEYFHYSGCKGNLNNFMIKLDCQEIKHPERK